MNDGPVADLQALAVHVELFCEHDRRGRLVDGRRPAPRFWLGRSVVGNIWRLRADLSEDRVREIARLIAREPGLEARPATRAPAEPDRAARIRALLEQDAPIEEEWRGPTFRFPRDLRAPSPASPSIRSLEPSEVALLETHFPERAASLADRGGARQPWIAWIENGVAVGWCRTACGDPAVAAEASVETAAGFRGRGIASQVVAVWAAAIRARGGLPLYSTAWANAPSLVVARKLGLEAYGESWHVR